MRSKQLFISVICSIASSTSKPYQNATTVVVVRYGDTATSSIMTNANFILFQSLSSYNTPRKSLKVELQVIEVIEVRVIIIERKGNHFIDMIFQIKTKLN